MMKTFAGKNALVTGGSSGIGLELAKRLAGDGANIWILARDPAKLEHACQEVTKACRTTSQTVDVIEADVSNQDQIFASIDRLIQLAGTPDLLVNAAGYCRPGLFEELDIQYFRQMMEIHYFGTLYVTKAVVPGMIQRKSGHIVNFSSIAGYHGVYGYAAYSPAKFAIHGLTDVLRYELKSHKIQVSLVYPPDTRTPGYEVEKQYYPPLMTTLNSYNTLEEPGYVADVIMKYIRKGRFLILPGMDNVLLYLANKLPGEIPYRILDLMMLEASNRLAKQKNGK